MKKSIWAKISILLDPFVYLAEVSASKAKEWRNETAEDLVLNHDKKDPKITEEMIKSYTDHCRKMDDMIDEIFNR